MCSFYKNLNEVQGNRRDIKPTRVVFPLILIKHVKFIFIGELFVYLSVCEHGSGHKNKEKKMKFGIDDYSVLI